MKKEGFILFAFLILFSSIYVLSATTGEFIIGKPLYCGDNIISNNEECDGINLSQQTCVTKGYSSGALKCTSKCTFDYSDCKFSGGGGSSGSKDYECSDNKDNDNDGLIDYPEDPGCTGILDNSEEDDICLISWNCGPWSLCIGGIQTRACTDTNYCYKEYEKLETRECGPIVINFSKPPAQIIMQDCRIYNIPCWIVILLAVALSLFIYCMLHKKKKKVQRRSKKRKSKKLKKKNQS